MVMMGEGRSSGDFWAYEGRGGGEGLCGFGGMI